MYATTITASPLSYSKACDTFRPRIGQSAAIRAGLGGKTFVHFLEPRAMLNRLVRKFCSEGRPAGIENGLRHAGFGESGGIHIAHRDIVELSNDAVRELVVKVVSAVRYLRMDCFDATLLARTLSNGQRLLRTTVDTLRFNPLPGGEGGEVFQAKVDADAAYRLTGIRRRRINVDDDIEEPVAPAIARKIRAVLDFAFWKRPAVEHSERVSGEPESVTFALQFASLDRHPPERPFATVSKIWPLLLGSGFRILLAYRVDRSGMQAQLLAAAGRQLIQIEPGQPRPPEAKGIFLPVAAVIPDKVTRAGLPVEQPGEGLHAVTIHKDHAVIIYSTSINRKATIASQSAPFLPAPEDGVSRSN